MKQLKGKIKVVFYWTETTYKGFTIRRYRRYDLDGRPTKYFNYEIWLNNMITAIAKTYQGAKNIINWEIGD